MPHPQPPDPRCTQVREAVSARFDGETTPLPAGAVDAHLTTCSDCREFGRGLEAVGGQVRALAADPVPDLAAPILAALAEERATVSRRRLQELRWIVALAGLVQLLVAVPLLLGAVDHAAHLGRDLGALQLALGIGLVLAGAQPQRAAGVLPIAAVVAAVAVVAGAVDVVAGRATLVAELPHATEVVGVVALRALTRHLPAQARVEPVRGTA